MLWDRADGVAASHAGHQDNAFNPEYTRLLDNVTVSCVVDALPGTFTGLAAESGDGRHAP